MNLIRIQIFSLILISLGLFLIGCSESESPNRQSISHSKSIIHLSEDINWATVSDPDGIKSIESKQRIPRGSGIDVYDVDFKFDEKGTTSYRIFIGGMFEKSGTVIHVDVTDMKGETSKLYIRRTAQKYQVGYYKKR
jgi:hypothetical protein